MIRAHCHRFVVALSALAGRRQGFDGGLTAPGYRVHAASMQSYATVCSGHGANNRVTAVRNHLPVLRERRAA